MEVDIKKLLEHLNPYCTRALEGASGLCITRGHYEVAAEHLLVQLLEDPKSDVPLILRHYEIDPAHWQKQLQRELETLRDGNPGRPVFSPNLIRWFEQAWMLSSLELGLAEIRSGALLGILAENPMRYGTHYLDGIQKLSLEGIRKEFHNVIHVSEEQSAALAAEQAPGGQAPGRGAGNSALKRFTTDYTARAKAGEIDPVLGRDREIRQIIDILARRRKNNPITVGEAGVGKTAVVEGLALKVAQGEVPDIIKDVSILGLDIGLLQAGASVKGEFENRLNSVISEVKSSEQPIILFIDEAHTLIGAGGAAGTGDAANLLKPALARGELRTIAATTWSEYKKYFEKDPALARRFQLVKLDEPTAEQAVGILRGLRSVYEQAHEVYIRDEAISAAAHLSARYISGRQLPDKAVDVLDTACARVKISLTTKPPMVDDLERQIHSMSRELTGLKRDVDSGRSSDTARVDQLDREISELRDELELALASWERERDAVHKVVELRKKQAEAEADSDGEEQQLNPELAAAIEELEALQDERGHIDYEVTAGVVGRVISDWTGIPIGNLVKDDAEALLGFRDSLRSWVRGQDHAIDLIDSGVRTAKAGLQNPEQPLGVFLLAGPSGVGKTETALGVANLLFGGDAYLTTINMSEYQEKHSVSRLIGSSAGYVGYGEGGVLTEAIRQRPYSVLLLDEVEKADLEVLNLFYQVFDKGELADGEGRVIDFRNTVIFLTSNLASDIIMDMCQGEQEKSMDEVVEGIRPQLQRHFKPALLARMAVIPYYPLKGEVLNDIVRVKLDKVAKRLAANQGLELTYGDEVVEKITERCTDSESGARNIDHLLNKTLLPQISTAILQSIGNEQEYTRMGITVGEDGRFVCEIA